MSLFGALGISGSALTAERVRIELVAENLANVYTTRTPAGTPYRRKVAAVASRSGSFHDVFTRIARRGEPAAGTRIVGIYEDPRPFQRVYDPGHPDADEEGYVLLPNVDVVEEMVNLTAAMRSYEANVTAFNATKSLIQSALGIGR